MTEWRVYLLMRWGRQRDSAHQLLWREAKGATHLGRAQCAQSAQASDLTTKLRGANEPRRPFGRSQSDQRRRE
jgi:hypothetical protein